LFSGSIEASDATSYSVFSGDLPTGVTLNTSTGEVSGTPTTPGEFSFVLRATNISGSVDTTTLTISVPTISRVWDGTSFVPTVTTVWDGTSFVPATTKVWNGSSWVNAK
jgi:hypothetical protein